MWEEKIKLIKIIGQATQGCWGGKAGSDSSLQSVNKHKFEIPGMQQRSEEHMIDGIGDDIQTKVKLAKWDFYTASKDPRTFDSHRCQTSTII